MELMPVSSSNLAAVGYDRYAAVLVVQFLNGAVYEYYGVPTAAYAGLLQASSKGHFLATQIKGRFEYCQVALAQ
jgi:hypothetical protein